MVGVPTSLARKIATAKKEAGKARAGKNSFPPTPFLFARPTYPAEVLTQAERNFLEVVGGIFLKMSSNFF
ncbi:MAG: hypothetical protein A3I85_02975 [Candidatus Nealsonbacteria bacterium RIFCSPLOWO2_02_FULL_38_63]|nr:MAG: hypothetical protein A3I85_02975 [Candidatus Nealsonbacteria bacterium RIFCSPLOWO2_02_FULL_38_63]